MVILARLRQENKGYSLFLNIKNKLVVLFFNQFGCFASIFFPAGLCWDFLCLVAHLRSSSTRFITQFIYIVLFHKSQPFQLPLVFFAGGDEVEPRGFQRAVPQHVRQLGYVPANVVKGPGEQVA